MENFNPEIEANRIIEFIRDYYAKNNLGGAIIGISGGKDSAVVAALFTKALGKENVIGVTMPCHSLSTDKSDAELISEHFGFEMINFDLTSTYDSFKNELGNLGEFNEVQTKNSDINIKPRLRMATLYYLAALYSSLKGKTYLVAGTSNKCELFVGYFTKGGDSVHDISPLADLTVDQVVAVGEYLGVPDKVVHKAPSDGLSGKTDEDKLGVTYKDIATFMENPEKLDKEVADKIEKLHKGSRHKFSIPTYKRGEQ